MSYSHNMCSGSDINLEFEGSLPSLGLRLCFCFATLLASRACVTAVRVLVQTAVQTVHFFAVFILMGVLHKA